MQDFYTGFAQRARDLADNADPFTRRRLLDLAQRYDLQTRIRVPRRSSDSKSSDGKAGDLGAETCAIVGRCQRYAAGIGIASWLAMGV